MKLHSEVKVSISGIRGRYPNELTLCDAAYLIRAFSRSVAVKSRPLVIGHDNRSGSREIHQVALKVLEHEGREVIDIGLAPLPTTGISVRAFDAAAGICITSSHNPEPWHGLKLLDKNGEFIDPVWVEHVLELFDRFDGDCSDAALPDEMFEASYQRKAYDEHLKLYPYSEFDQTIAVDAVNNSGSFIIPELIERLGSKPLPIACDPKKLPNRPYEPTIDNLVTTGKKIKELDCNFGIAVDPDADRLVLINHDGQVISEEYTIVLAAWHMLESGYSGPIVVNLSTSSLINYLAKQYDREVLRSAVGEPNVVAMMKTNSALIGGEGNGGVIDGTRHFSRDSLSGIYHISSLLHKNNGDLNGLIKQLPKREMVKHKLDIPVDQTMDEIYASLKKVFKKAGTLKVVDESDGLRLEFDNHDWIHIRPSNTEPILRLFGESDAAKKVNRLFETVDDVLQKKL